MLLRARRWYTLPTFLTRKGSVPIHCLVYQRDDAFHSSALENSEVVCGMLGCGGNSCFCVRECGELERLHWQCHEFGGMRVPGCQGPRSPFLPGVHPEIKSQIVRLTGNTSDGVNDALAFAACCLNASRKRRTTRLSFTRFDPAVKSTEFGVKEMRIQMWLSE